MAQARPIEAHFEKCDTIRAQHLLWEDVLGVRPDLRSTRFKMAFYMLLSDNPWGATRGTDEHGNLGYGLRFIP